MQYKNIIFDLGNVLVKLNPEGCIGAFKAIGMGELVDSNPQSEGMKLMSKLGVGMITTEAFCDAARELTGSDVTNEEIIDAANKMLVVIPDEKKERLLQLKKAGYRLFLLSNTIDIPGITASILLAASMMSSFATSVPVNLRAASQNSSVVIIPTPSLLISFIPSL